MTTEFPLRTTLLVILLLLFNSYSESLNIAGFSLPASGGRLTLDSWDTVLEKCQLFLANEKLDAFSKLAQAAIPYVPVGLEIDAELLASQILYHSGSGMEAYIKVKKLIEPLQKLTPEERKKQPLIAQGYLKKFLLRIAAQPVIARTEKLEQRAEGTPNDVQPVIHNAFYTCFDLRNALNLIDLYREFDSQGFSTINKTLMETFDRKRLFSLGYRNHGRVEISQERAADQAIISVDLWAKPALPNSLARQIQLYWGMDFFAYCLPSSISIYDLTYATTKHVQYEVGKIVSIDTYGSEEIDRGYRAYAETIGSVEASLTDVLSWLGINPNSWHASVPALKVKEEKIPPPSKESPPVQESSYPRLPSNTPDFQ